MSDERHDVDVLRRLAAQYAQAAAEPIQHERRRLWQASNGLEPTRPLVLARFGMWNVWCRETFGEHTLACRDAFCRRHERTLRVLLFHQAIGDDRVFEPWYDMPAAVELGWDDLWGVRTELHKNVDEGSGLFDPPIKEWSDLAKLAVPVHSIDESITALWAERLHTAFGDILPINVQRGPICQGGMADISTCLARLRGLQQIMIDMYESPAELKKLLAFLRDGVLANQRQAEKVGDFGLTDQGNQSQCYASGMEAPQPNTHHVSRKALWTHMAAQEFTLISPAMHEEFLLNYQMPIMAEFGLVSYGCCEDLTRKIDMLRKVPNLRIIAVTLVADVKRCAEQIGSDYVISWRPNPTDVISCGWDEGRIRRIIRHGLEVMAGLHVQIQLKDVETVEGDPTRMARWSSIVRQEIDSAWK